MLTACMHCVTVVKKSVHVQLPYPLFVTLWTVLWWEIAVLLSCIVSHPLCACTVYMQVQKCLYVHMHNHNTIHLPPWGPVMTNNWVIVNYWAEWIVCTCHMQKHAHVHMHNCNSFHLRTWELFCDEKYLSYCQLLFFMNKKTWTNMRFVLLCSNIFTFFQSSSAWQSVEVLLSLFTGKRVIYALSKNICYWVIVGKLTVMQ